MIAHFIADDGQEARFLLHTITIPPHHLIRKGRQWAVQPDWKIPTSGSQHITARYRLTAAPNIDYADPMNEAQISHEEKRGVEIAAEGQKLFDEDIEA
jgi:hypothetical protein